MEVCCMMLTEQINDKIQIKKNAGLLGTWVIEYA